MQYLMAQVLSWKACRVSIVIKFSFPYIPCYRNIPIPLSSCMRQVQTSIVIAWFVDFPLLASALILFRRTFRTGRIPSSVHDNPRKRDGRLGKVVEICYLVFKYVHSHIEWIAVIQLGRCCDWQRQADLHTQENINIDPFNWRWGGGGEKPQRCQSHLPVWTWVRALWPEFSVLCEALPTHIYYDNSKEISRQRLPNSLGRHGRIS